MPTENKRLSSCLDAEILVPGAMASRIKGFPEVLQPVLVLVIIDPVLRMARVRDANENAQISAALEPLMTIARQHSTHVLLVYHLGKGERADPTDAILGSTAFFAAVDTALVMKRREL